MSERRHQTARSEAAHAFAVFAAVGGVAFALLFAGVGTDAMHLWIAGIFVGCLSGLVAAFPILRMGAQKCLSSWLRLLVYCLYAGVVSFLLGSIVVVGFMAASRAASWNELPQVLGHLLAYSLVALVVSVPLTVPMSFLAGWITRCLVLRRRGSDKS